MSAPATVRRVRRAVVVVVGGGQTSGRPAVALAESLRKLGIEAAYLGRVEHPELVARAVSERSADAVELCLSGAGGISFLRRLLGELAAVNRRDVNIVVHRLP